MKFGMTDFEGYTRKEIAELYQIIFRIRGLHLQLISKEFDSYPVLEGAEEDQLNTLVLVRGLEYFNEINIGQFELQIHEFVKNSGWDGSTFLQVKVATIARIDETILTEIHFRFGGLSFELEILDFDWLTDQLNKYTGIYEEWRIQSFVDKSIVEDETLFDDETTPEKGRRKLSPLDLKNIILKNEKNNNNFWIFHLTESRIEEVYEFNVRISPKFFPLKTHDLLVGINQPSNRLEGVYIVSGKSNSSENDENLIGFSLTLIYRFNGKTTVNGIIRGALFPVPIDQIDVEKFRSFISAGESNRVNSRPMSNLDLIQLIQNEIAEKSKFWWYNDKENTWKQQILEPGQEGVFSLNVKKSKKLDWRIGELILLYDLTKDQRIHGILKLTNFLPENIQADLVYEFEEKPSINDLAKLSGYMDSDISGELKSPVIEIKPEFFLEIVKSTEIINKDVESQESRHKIDEPPNADPAERHTRDKIPFHNDIVAAEDKLGREPVAKAFVDLIKKDVFTEEMSHSFMVHLQGEWGVGKSTFLNLIKKQLNNGGEEWLVVDYNAWQNQHITPPWWTLIDQVYRQTKIRKGYWWLGKLRRKEKWRRIKLYSGWQKIIAILLTVIITTCLVYFGNSIVDYIMALSFFKGDQVSIETGSAIGVFSKLFLTLSSIVTIIFTFSKVISSSFFMNSSDEANSFLKRSADPMSRIKSHFSELVDDINSKEKKRQLAIFIDDIDRCNREFIVQLLEGIQTLFKEKRVLYIVAGDKSWISTSFENTYSEFSTEESSRNSGIGELFLEKVFQLSLRMPNISETYKEEYWSHILGISESKGDQKAKIEEISPELKKEVLKELNSTSEDIVSPEFIRNFEMKHNLSSNTASSLIIEKKNESDTEIRHLLEDLHKMVETNPRSIIRLANNYTMTRSTLIAERKNINSEKLFRWLILKDQYPNALVSVRTIETIEEFKEELKASTMEKSKQGKCLELIGENQETTLTLTEIKEFEGI